MENEYRNLLNLLIIFNNIFQFLVFFFGYQFDFRNPLLRLLNLIMREARMKAGDKTLLLMELILALKIFSIKIFSNMNVIAKKLTNSSLLMRNGGD